MGRFPLQLVSPINHSFLFLRNGLTFGRGLLGVGGGEMEEEEMDDTEEI